ncbi:hypothetical protein JW930_05100 [Candidatus Woesearchaeota archaeon]|nr:hypothetical protein [Candidatus Woesearchaeota archaeon]
MVIGFSTFNSTPFRIPSNVSINSTKEYLTTLPSSAFSGDVASIIIILLVGFILLILINQLSGLFIAILKKTILFIIVALVAYDFLPKYMTFLKQEGYSFSAILVGIGSLVICVGALYVASRGLFRTAKKRIEDMKFKVEHYGKAKLGEESKAVHPEYESHTTSVKDAFSKHAIQSDKSLLTVLLYCIVAEFGVFSSRTISAPSVKVGVTFFAIFVVALLIFIKTYYADYKVALTYLSVTFGGGLLLAIILGHFWGNYPLVDLLSINFFKTDSLVALITGISVSMFAGSKG